MAFKTKEEMFGDDAGFGARVPVDMSNPPGTSAGNRGIQFGEQVTAAIANRTHWALALNDEDLNARLVAFETGGLNGAYDNGSVGPPGGGRDITKDSGAVETISSHSAMSGDAARDNAHYRANALGDTAGASIGYDFKSRRVGANGQSGFDAVAGILDRRVFAKASGLTILTDSVAATLNPGGALPTTVRLSVGQFHSGGKTDLMKDADLVEIGGGTQADGLYIFAGLGVLTTDGILRNLDGSTPALPADQACTVTVYRVRLGSFGSFTGRGKLVGVVVSGMPDAPSALDLFPGRNQSDTPDGGSECAMRVRYKDVDGSLFTVLEIDSFGRLNGILERSDIPDEADKNRRLGNYMIWKTHAANPGVGMIVHSYDPALAERYDYLSLVPYDPPVTPPIKPNTGVTMTFTANSPVTGELLFGAPQDPNLPNYLIGVGMFVEISGAGTSNGLYYVAAPATSGNKGFLLRRADGSVPSHFPTGGTCTLTAVYTASGLGRVVTFPNAQALTSSPSTVKAYNLITGGPETNASGLVMFMPNQIGGGQRAFVRMFASSPASGDQYQEKFSIDSLGEVRTRGAIYAGEGSAFSQGFVINTTDVNAEFKYGTMRQRFVNIGIQMGQSKAGDWDFIAGEYWESKIANTRIFFPITPFVPQGATLVAAEVHFEGAVGGDARVAFASWTSDWSTPSPSSLFIVGTTTFQASSSSPQIIRHAPGAPPAIDNPNKWIAVMVEGRSGGIGDRIRGVRIEFLDPGPRNF